MALVRIMDGWWDTEAGCMVDPTKPVKPPKHAPVAPKPELVDNSTAAPKKAAKKAKK